MIERLSRCRVIARLGAGTDKIDVAEATRRGIVVTNVPDFCLNEQAEHTLALLLAFARRLPFMMEAMRTHSWSARHHPGVHRLAGQTLGLIGFGTSARAVAQRAAAFSLRLLAWVRDPTKYRDIAKSLQVELVSLDHLLSKSDFVSIHLPLCEETHHLLSRERLIQMKPTAVLINTARGAIVDEAARWSRCFSDGRSPEPRSMCSRGSMSLPCPERPPHPLLNLDNVILTPHCAGSSVESSRESKVRGARNAADVLLGIRPQSIVNPAVVPRFPLQVGLIDE